MSKLTRSNSHSIYRPSGSTRVSRKRIYRVPNPKMKGGGFFEGFFGGAETSATSNSTTTNEGDKTPTTPGNVNMTGSVETPTDDITETAETQIEGMTGSVNTTPDGVAEPQSDMSTSTTIPPIDNSLPENTKSDNQENDKKNDPASSSIMDTISGAWSAATDSFNREKNSAKSLMDASPTDSIDKSSQMDIASDNDEESSQMDIASDNDEESSQMDTASDNDDDDLVGDKPQNTEPVIGDLIKLLSEKDVQISTLLGQLDSANKNFADANKKLVESLTGKNSPESATVSPEMGSPEMGSPEMGSPEMGSPEMGSPEMGSPEMGSPEMGPTKSIEVESNKGGKTRNRSKKQRRTRRKQMRV